MRNNKTIATINESRSFPTINKPAIEINENAVPQAIITFAAYFCAKFQRSRFLIELSVR